MRCIAMLFAMLFFFHFSYAQSFKKKYKGKVGPYPVTLTLIAKDGALTGTYYYERFNEPISVKGYITGKSIEMSGYDLKGNKIDRFIGQYSQFDIHGIWIGEESRSRNSFNFTEVGATFTSPSPSSQIWLFVSSLFIVSTAFVTIYLIRRKGNRKIVEKFVEKIDKNVSEKLNEREKGYAFEKYMTERLSDDFYRLLEWRSDKYYNGRYALSSLKPDLEFERKNTTHVRKIFSVECKYRSKLFNGTIDLGKKWKIVEYKKYSNESNKPVFLALGLGGKASAPEFVYIIPIEKVNDEVIQLNDIAEFRISRQQLYYDPENNTLK